MTHSIQQALAGAVIPHAPMLPREPVSPWNPSRRATARVTNPLPAPTICQNCGSPVDLVCNSKIYRKPWGDWPWAFLCTKHECRSYVGLHPFTGIPLGTLADKPTREARQEAKNVFNPIWKSGRKTRSEAYIWLAGRLGLPAGECHIGWFDAAMCCRVIDACRGSYAN